MNKLIPSRAPSRAPSLAPAFALVALTATVVGCAAPLADDVAPDHEPPELTLSWAAEPREHGQECVSLPVDEDLDIAAVETFATPGAQRIVVWHAPASGAVEGCPAVDARGLIFDGLEAFELPEGVALHVPAGQQLWLRVDLFNDADVPLEGESGVALVAASRPTAIADVVTLSADLGEADRCEMPVDTFLFGVAPEVAGDASVELVAQSSFAGGDVTLIDDGAAGSRLLAQPVALRAGEAITAACRPATGVFATAASEADDCEVAVYRFPADAVGCR